MNPKAVRLPVLTLILALLFSASVRAQMAGATLTGTVTDSKGIAIVSAKVSVHNVATNVMVETTTNASGVYTVPNLNAADYDISISAPGASATIAKVTLTVGAKQEMSVALSDEQGTPEVSIAGVAPQIELSTSTIASNVEGREIRELPLNGRDWVSLATLQPGVATVRTQEQVTQTGSDGRGLGLQLTIDGNRPTQNTYRLNGIIINDYSNAGPGSVLGQNLGVEAIEEFSVLTSNYSAEYGYTSGGVVNAITRSGTNAFHGSAYEFLRNSVLDAPQYFENHNGLKKSPFRRNQFGGAAGGPIKKGKIFVFGNYEGLRQTKGIPHVSIVPSSTARNGILNDANGNPLPALPPGFACPANSTLPVPGQSNTCVDNQMARFFTFYPAANAGLLGPSNNTGNYAFSGAQIIPENYYTARVDINTSTKDSLNSSYYYDHSSFTQPDNFNQVNNQIIVGRQGASIEESHFFGPTMVNTVRLGYNRTYGYGLLTPNVINAAATDKSFGMGAGGAGYAPIIIVAGLEPFRGGLNGATLQDYRQQTVQLYDDAERTAGTHSVKFGAMFVRLEENLFAPFNEDGSATFSGLSNFLTNNVSIVAGPSNLAAISPHYNRDSIVGLYLQDDWHIRPSLTLNLGLRYEMATIPTEKNGRIANLPTITTDPADGVFNNVYFKSNPTLTNFEPRIGFAWDSFHNGKTAVRGGFGVFDALPLPYELVINNAQTSPFHVTSTLHSPGQGLFPNNLTFATGSPAAAQAWNYVQPNPGRNYIYQWNLNVERQVRENTMVTVAYAGSRGYHNPFQLDDINTVFPFHSAAGWLFPNPVGSSVIPVDPTSIVPGQLINPNVGAIQSTLWTSRAWYDALQIEADKRMSHGIEVHGSFTWAKSEDTSSGSFAGDNFAGDVTPTIPWWDQRITKGLSDFAIKRNLVINALWNVPTPRSFSGPASWVAKGWELGGILQLSDGVPVWPLDGLEGDPMGQLNSEPLAIPDVIVGLGCRSLTNPGNVANYIKAQCLENAVAPSPAFYSAAPPLGCDPKFAYPTCINLLGNLGRNSIIGPGLFNVDFSMVKDTNVPRISDTFDVQFHAEFFNLFNHPNFAPPVNNLEAFDATGASVPGFGQINATQTPGREIQLALKIIW
jgi:Carboxypeptidase regulatory-like domain/TonB dependent receptor/TonB-dependent Receptor Plug Domain